MAQFTGGVALVTGGSSGMGRGTAVAFAKEGAKVVVASRRSDEGQETIHLIRQAGSDGLFVKSDVTKEAVGGRRPGCRPGRPRSPGSTDTGRVAQSWRLLAFGEGAGVATAPSLSPRKGRASEKSTSAGAFLHSWPALTFSGCRHTVAARTGAGGEARPRQSPWRKEPAHVRDTRHGSPPV
jgi:short chain dehydrogenase